MAFFYDLGISYPNEESAEKIIQEFEQYALLLFNNQELIFDCYTEQWGLEWFVGIHPQGMVFGRAETNPALLQSEVIIEAEEKIYELLRQNADWEYHYAIFQGEAYELIREEELLAELLNEYEEALINNRSARNFFQLYYSGLVLSLPLAQALGIVHLFEPFNTYYCWIPHTEKKDPKD